MQFIYLQQTYTWKELLEIKTQEQWFLDIQDFIRNWFDDSYSLSVTTSGSTGTPKPIALSKADMRTSASITNMYFHLDDQKVALLCLPAKYIAGKMMIVRAIEADMDLILEEPSSRPLRNLEQPVDFVALTPMQVKMILDHNNAGLNRVKTIIIGGGAVSLSLAARLQSIECKCYQTYGMTETITHIALQPINGRDKTDHFQVLKGFDISKDERDCLTISAAHIYNQHVVTNDLVEIIGSKSFRWLGRYDNVINSGGVKVHPEVIESKIQSFIKYPFFIIGIDDEQLGQSVTLCIESTSSNLPNQGDLINQIESRLSKFEIPKSILFFDCFLYTETGKIRRRATVESL